MNTQNITDAAIEAAQLLSTSADGAEVDTAVIATRIKDYFNTFVVGNPSNYIDKGVVHTAGYYPTARNKLTKRSTVKELSRWSAWFLVSPEGEIKLDYTSWSNHFYMNIELEWNAVPLNSEEKELLIQMDKGELIYNCYGTFADDFDAGLVELQWFNDIAAQRLGVKPNAFHVLDVQVLLEEVAEGREVRTQVGKTNFYMVFFQRFVNKEEYKICTRLFEHVWEEGRLERI